MIIEPGYFGEIGYKTISNNEGGLNTTFKHIEIKAYDWNGDDLVCVDAAMCLVSEKLKEALEHKGIANNDFFPISLDLSEYFGKKKDVPCFFMLNFRPISKLYSYKNLYTIEFDNSVDVVLKEFKLSHCKIEGRI